MTEKQPTWPTVKCPECGQDHAAGFMEDVDGGRRRVLFPCGHQGFWGDRDGQLAFAIGVHKGFGMGWNAANDRVHHRWASLCPCAVCVSSRPAPPS